MEHKMEHKLSPVYRDFGNSFVSSIGRQVIEFFYPPLMIKQMVDVPKVEAKLQMLPFIVGLTVLVVSILAIVGAVVWILKYRKQKGLRQTNKQLRNSRPMPGSVQLGSTQPIPGSKRDQKPMQLANIQPSPGPKRDDPAKIKENSTYIPAPVEPNGRPRKRFAPQDPKEGAQLIMSGPPMACQPAVRNSHEHINCNNEVEELLHQSGGDRTKRSNDNNGQ